MAHSSGVRSSEFAWCFTTSVFCSSCLSQTTSLALKELELEDADLYSNNSDNPATVGMYQAGRQRRDHAVQWFTAGHH